MDLETEADSDLKLSGGPGFDLLTLLAFLPSAISSFFLPKIRGAAQATPLDLPLRDVSCFLWREENQRTWRKCAQRKVNLHVKSNVQTS